jgi:hypothetical protein
MSLRELTSEESARSLLCAGCTRSRLVVCRKCPDFERLVMVLEQKRRDDEEKMRRLFGGPPRIHSPKAPARKTPKPRKPRRKGGKS